jgi:hypothetical protein
MMISARRSNVVPKWKNTREYILSPFFFLLLFYFFLFVCLYFFPFLLFFIYIEQKNRGVWVGTCDGRG